MDGWGRKVSKIVPCWSAAAMVFDRQEQTIDLCEWQVVEEDSRI